MHTLEINLFKMVQINKCAASKDETRYYLNGVLVEVKDSKTTMVATDGHKLIASQSDNSLSSDVEFSVIIPRSVLVGYKFTRHSDHLAKMTVVDGTDITIEHEEGKRMFGAIDGVFPDWRRVIPDNLSGETAHFNPKYIADFSTYNKAMLGGSMVLLSHNGKGPGLVELPDGDIGVIMPIRVPNLKPPVSPPTWYKAA